MHTLKGGFVTHLHSDHVADLFNLFLLGWGTGGHRIVDPVRVYGPGNPHGLPTPTSGVDPAPLANPENPTPGTSELLAEAIDGWAYDLNIPTRYNSRRGLASLIEAHDVLPPADVGATRDGDVAPAMEPFVIYEDDRVRVSATLVLHPPVFPSFGYRFETDDGRIASEAGVQRVALSHIGPGDPREVRDATWRRGVRSAYRGDVTVGHDLHQFAFPSRRR